MGHNFKKILVLFILSMLACPPASAVTDRGIGVKVKSATGKTKKITLYSGYYALVIGCSNYTAGWPDLPNPVKDAVEVADVLRKKGWTVNTLLNPDSDRLNRSLSELISGPGRDPSKAVFIWFSGHGHTIKKANGKNMGYLVPVDAPDPNKDFSGFINRAVNMRRIEDVSMLMQSKHVLMAFDSCFSGSISQMRAAPPPFIEEKVTLPVRQYITAGTENEKVPDESVFKTVFVQGITKGFADLNRDGYITGEELGHHLQVEVVNHSNKQQHPQYGKINDPEMNKGDFIIETTKSFDDNNIAGDTWQDPVTGMEFVWVPAGCFEMGCVSQSNECETDETPVHKVCLDGYWMGRYEVTNAQFRQFRPEHDSRTFRAHSLNADDQPAVLISWKAARDYAEWLSRENNSHYTFRLPTEAQWEFAARTKTTTARFWGNDTGEACRFANVYDEYALTDTSFDWPHHDCNDGFVAASPVGSFRGNSLGLYDMLGNASEWCRDVYRKDAYSSHSAKNPENNSGGKYRVHRGGSWGVRPVYVRSADRNCNNPNLRQSSVGFRLVRTY